MLISTASFAAVAVALLGLLIFWSNPDRIINRFFFSFSLHLAAWLTCLHLAVSSGEQPVLIRLTSAIGGLVPVHMWLVKEACIGRRVAEIFRKGIPWIFAGTILAGIACTHWYVAPGIDRPAKFGSGYFVFMVIFVALHLVLCRQTVRQIREQQGARRLELQVLLLGGSAMCIGIIMLMALRALLHEIWPIHLQPVVVLLFYAGTMVAITTHRVFNARQIILVGLQKFVLISVAVLIAFVVDFGFEHIGLPKPLAWFFTAAVALWAAAGLNDWLSQKLHFYPEGISARQAAFAAARETRTENLESAFARVLKGWGQAEHAIVLSGNKSSVRGLGIEMNDDVLLNTVRELRWVTPERLLRERLTPQRAKVAQFLTRHGLSALAISDGHALAVVVGVGANAARRPFTYPQMVQLMELASIFGSAFERAHFSVKAQHAEQLATVGLLGASLAHEIRNPLVSIKTFVQLLPNHHQDPAFRAKFFRLISDEVGRIDQLTEQLLDLASPRVYSAQTIELHPVLRASLDLVAAKAADKRVDLVTEFHASPDVACTDPSAAKQVMLNLCFNAIQAVESHNGPERWIRVATRNTAAGIEMAIADSGGGISPEIRPRLFQPFQTTKSTGFGLGLAICSDILANLNASISVDPPEPGRGATFRVTFPCQPLSS